MKKAIIYLSMFALVLAGCDPMADIYDALEEMDTGYAGSVEYTLTTDDYATIAELAEDIDAEDAEFIAGKMFFNDTISPAVYIPPFLSELYPGLSEGSVALITYNINEDMPDDLSAYTEAESYTIAEDEYESIDEVLQAAKYYSPSYAPEVYIPLVLADGVTDPVVGDILLVGYDYSTVDPLVDYDNVAMDVLFEEDFEESLGQFTAFSLVGDQAWYASSYGDDTYAKMSGYYSAALDNEDWLVSGAISLSGESEIYLNFRHTAKYVNDNWDQLTVLVSTDFDGEDVEGASWDELSGYTNPSGSDYTFVESGDIDLSSYAGQTIYVAFRYLSTTSNAATWEVDWVQVLVPGTEYPIIGEEPESYKNYYEYTSSGWVAMEDVVYVNAVDYNAMGTPGSYDNFSSSALPQDYLPALLNQKYPLAGQDYSVVVVYNYYTSTSLGTIVLADEYVFNEGEWESTYGYVSEATAQFIYSSGEWVFDPTVIFTVSNSDLQLIVDWIKANIGSEYIDSYGTADYYTGASAYYGNFDTRSGYWEDEVFGSWQEAVQYALGSVLLPQKYPSAVTDVSGIDVYYIITFETYDGGSTDYTWTFQCTSSGPDPEFTYIEE